MAMLEFGLRLAEPLKDGASGVGVQGIAQGQDTSSVILFFESLCLSKERQDVF